MHFQYLSVAIWNMHIELPSGICQKYNKARGHGYFLEAGGQEEDPGEVNLPNLGTWMFGDNRKENLELL